jgi:hypothetical protein
LFPAAMSIGKAQGIMAPPERDERSLVEVHREKVRREEQEAEDLRKALEYRQYLEQERAKWRVYREKRRQKEDERRRERKRKKAKHRKRKKKSSKKKHKKKSRRRSGSDSSDSGSSSDSDSDSSSSSSSSLESEEDFKLYLEKKEKLKRKMVKKHIEEQAIEAARNRQLQKRLEDEQHRKLQQLHEQREARMAVHNQAVEQRKRDMAKVAAEHRRQMERDREAITLANQLVTQKDGPWPVLEPRLPLRVFCCLPGLAWATRDQTTGELKAREIMDGKTLAEIDEW